MHFKNVEFGQCECDRLYYLDIDFKPIACSSYVFTFNLHCWSGHPSLQVLKLLVPESNHIMFLDCESCQLGKDHLCFILIRSIKGQTSCSF